VPRWPDEPIESGRLEEPRFVRGFDPMAHQWRPPPRPSVWKRHFELGRQNPAVWNPATQQYDGGWMLVSEVKKGGPRARQARIESDRWSIKQYVDKHWPLERWQLRTVTLVGTWCDKELYMRFLGTLTPEEDALDRKQRREAWEARQVLIGDNRRRRAQEARDKAAREELEARTKIRQRRNNQG
jgi:hypothetical protein